MGISTTCPINTFFYPLAAFRNHKLNFFIIFMFLTINRKIKIKYQNLKKKMFSFKILIYVMKYNTKKFTSIKKNIFMNFMI